MAQEAGASIYRRIGEGMQRELLRATGDVAAAQYLEEERAAARSASGESHRGRHFASCLLLYEGQLRRQWFNNLARPKEDEAQ